RQRRAGELRGVKGRRPRLGRLDGPGGRPARGPGERGGARARRHAPHGRPRRTPPRRPRGAPRARPRGPPGGGRRGRRLPRLAGLGLRHRGGRPRGRRVPVSARPDAQRVVITGMGLVTPIGIGREEVWAAALAGRSGAGPITRFDCSDMPVKIACEVTDFVPEDFMDRRSLRRTDRFAQMAVAARRIALAGARLEINGDGRRVGAAVATGSGGNETFKEHHRVLLERGPDRLPPTAVPIQILNMGAGQVSMALGLRGPTSCAVTACASSGHAIGDAAEQIRRGAADVMLAGGAEAGGTRFCMAGLDATPARSRSSGPPEAASRPFDRGRDGFVMGEGAVLLVLESFAGARARGATILAELAGYAATADAHHVTEPDPTAEPQARVM